ncbi:hypothetical protein ACHAXS_007626 [Conticribra weissflogii]
MVDEVEPQKPGIVGAETLMESIQNCHVSIEESRRRLLPLLTLLEEHDGNPKNSNSLQYADFTDGQIAHEILDFTESAFASTDTLMIRLGDSGLISMESHCDGNSNVVRENVLTGDDQSVYLLMASNCIAKAFEFITGNFFKLAEADSVSSFNSGSGPFDDSTSSIAEGVNEGEEFKIQPCMARLAELALRMINIQSLLPPSIIPPTRVHHLKNHDDDSGDEEDTEVTFTSISHTYAQYQRRCLRSRSKQVISNLVELRRLAQSQNCFVSDILEEERKRQQLELTGGAILDDDDLNGGHDGHGGLDGYGADTVTQREQPHAQTITVILGEASSLIQPLAAWRDAIPPDAENTNCSMLRKMCQEAMDVLDHESQNLAVTVGSWFGKDQRGIYALEHDKDAGNSQESADLLSMEAALEEMAFSCQVISRYCVFSQQTVVNHKVTTTTDRNHDSNLQNLLTEQSLHYSTLETRLATLQFAQALSLASPQLIELGRQNLKVPSIVEDAHYLCVRAIERAAGTRSERAIWTVGHWICETWGVDESGGIGSGGGVFRALMEGVGCTAEKSMKMPHQNESDRVETMSKIENSFAAALLESMDDDIGHDENAVGTGTAPPSGGMSSALWEKIGVGEKFGENKEKIMQTKIDAELCALNGIYAAANACSALSGLFAELVEERLQDEGVANGGKRTGGKSSMLTFARDELASHSRSYQRLLQQRVRSLITDWCGADDVFDCDGRLCLQNLRLFIENEVYNLDSASFKTLENEDRLEVEIIGPVRKSQIFIEVGQDKCDVAVILHMAEAMSLKSTEIILDLLFRGNKAFNDWGALLLSKQVRMLQNLYCGLVLDSTNTGTTAINTASILEQFERINQAVSILQLEKPSDWLAFAYQVGESNDTNLTVDEIQKVMRLRVDFSEDAIMKVCSQLKAC